jgi:membrane protein DedA with SNARE-associated domain
LRWEIEMTLPSFDVHSVFNTLAAGGYILLFGLLVACGMGLPLPEDIPLIAAGALIAKGTFSWPVAALVGWSGIMVGDLVLYHIGVAFGRGVTRLPLIGKHVTAQRLDDMEAKFQRYGIAVVAIGRLFAYIRGAMVVVAGIIRYPLVPFMLADGVAALISGGMFMYLGYYLGNRLDDEVILRFKHWFWTGVGCVAIVCLVWFLWRSRRARLAAERSAALARAGLIDVPASVHDAGASFNIGKAGQAVADGTTGTAAVKDAAPAPGLVRPAASTGKV